MSNLFVDNNYTISFYSSSAGQYITSYPSSSVTQSVVTQSVTQSLLNNYTWAESTGSTYSAWNIITGGSEIAVMNSNNTSDYTNNGVEIGSRIYVRNNEIFTNVFRDASAEANNGIAIYSSSSSGWVIKDYINIPTSSVSNGDARRVAQEFSLDGDYMTVSVGDTNGNSSKLHIYKSSSSGWAVEEILTTSSYNSGSAVNDSDGDGAFVTSVIKDGTIFAPGFYSGYYNRFAAFFKSSSAGGWEFEDEVQVGDSSHTSISEGITGVSIDFDGTTAVLGSMFPDGSEYYQNKTGRVHVFTSSSSGWSQEKLGLSGTFNLTGNVSSSTEIPSPYSDYEYRTWTHFGYKSCAVSGNYIAAAAQSVNVDDSGGIYHRRRHSVFLLKSSSSGWEIEQRLDDPATNLILSHSNMNSTSNTEFGTGLVLKDNVLVVNSPEWKSDWSSNYTEGRVYVYVSSSSGGWQLDQTIDNPYSGSIFKDYGSSGTNKQLGYNNQGGYANAGDYGFGSLPGLSGNILVLNAPSFTYHSSSSGINIGGGVYASTIYGAMVVMSGSGSYYDHEYETEATESVEVTSYVTQSGGPVPFRFSSKGAFNIRGQAADNPYKTFIGEQKS